MATGKKLEETGHEYSAVTPCNTYNRCYSVDTSFTLHRSVSLNSPCLLENLLFSSYKLISLLSLIPGLINHTQVSWCFPWKDSFSSVFVLVFHSLSLSHTHTHTHFPIFTFFSLLSLLSPTHISLKCDSWGCISSVTLPIDFNVWAEKLPSQNSMQCLLIRRLTMMD